MPENDIAEASLPRPSAVLELLKPVTWFAPMWAFMCGVVSSGVSIAENWGVMLAGIVLAGPLVCAASQAANDWYDRDVDAINEPGRPIPSGRIPGRWGLYIALIWSGISLVWGARLGLPGLWATLIGVALGWAYSTPPYRLKMSGVWGPAAVAFSYEGLAWFTGAAVMLGAVPGAPVLWMVLLYSVGAHGIMTLNDFKAVEGDRAMGIRSLPVVLGVKRAALLACAVMAVPQIAVIAFLLDWGHPWHAGGIAALLAAQLALMPRLLRNPKEQAPWYNATGTTLSVLGMLVAAFAISGMQGVS